MSGSWIQDCKKILDQINTLEDEGKDRLDMVRTIRFILYALQRSLSGWLEWINNPNVMTKFTLKELKEINNNLSKLTRPFIEYDCEITSSTEKDWVSELNPETRREQPKKPKDIFYVR